MTTVNRVHSSFQPYSQLSHYVTLIQLSMTQRGNHHVLGVNLKLTLEQEKQIPHQGFQTTTLAQH